MQWDENAGLKEIFFSDVLDKSDKKLVSDEPYDGELVIDESDDVVSQEHEKKSGDATMM